MPRLSKSDISYIHHDLKNRGVGYSALRSELVDHLCCEVEELMAKEIPFKQAYEQVLANSDEVQLISIQNQTIKSDNYNFFMLWKNNIKIMFRNMMKYKNYTAINIAGLSLGLMCFVVIVLYVRHEVTYDRMFTNHEKIYRITMSTDVGGTSNKIPTSYPVLGPILQGKFAGITDYVRIINYKYSRLSPTVRVGDKIVYEDNVIFADSSFFKLFDFPLLQGNAKTALLNPNSVVITESMARKYFGTEMALGKQLNFNNKGDLEVTGVLADLPSNTHLRFDFLIPMSNLGVSGVFSTQALDNWQIDWFWTYFVIDDSNAIPAIEKSATAMVLEKNGDFGKPQFYIQALDDVHLHSDFDYGTDITQPGDMKNLYIFISVCILILLVCSINFVNITIATANRRYKEIGISKVLGAMRSQLRMQFMTESVLVSIVALIVAMLLLQLTLPLFSQLLGVTLTLNFFREPLLLMVLTGFAVLLGLVSGLYPAFFMASFNPQRVLKGIWSPGGGGARFRSVLVGFQVSISIFLIIGTMVVYQQLQYIQDKNLGYDKEQLIMLTIRGTAIPKTYYAFKHKLESRSDIMSVTSVSEPVGREVQFMGFKVEGQEADQFVKILNVGYDFVETMGLNLVDGRDFSRDVITDSIAGFIVNEAAAKHYGWKDPVGKHIKHAFWPGAPEGTVVGVVKDFNFEPLHASIDPLIIFKGFPAWFVAVRVKPGDLQQSLSWIESAWKEFEPGKPFNYHFLDQSIQKVYEKEERVSKVFFVFSFMSIITASLGLFGLVSFIAEQRLAEIGLRKVLGASVRSILALISKDFFILAVIAFVIAAPISYLIMDRWLETFAFRISFNAGYSVIALAIVLFVVIGTVVIRSLRAARSNPVDVLRTE